MNLTGKRVVITGAGGGLGRVVASTALALNASLVLLDVAFGDGEKGQENDRVLKKAVDLTDLEATRSCFEEIGPVDVIFNLAGGFAMGPTVYEVSDEDWDFMFRLNVKTLHNVLRAAVPAMVEQGRGSIVNVGAFGALRGQGNMSAYGASKSVVMRLTESLSEEVKHKGINVNAVLPSVIDTAANRQGMPDADFDTWVKPEQLANVICFLGSDAASAVHGVLLPVTGLV